MSRLRKNEKWQSNKVEKWQKLTAGLNPNHMHIFKPWKKDLKSCIEEGLKLYDPKKSTETEGWLSY